MSVLRHHDVLSGILDGAPNNDGPFLILRFFERRLRRYKRFRRPVVHKLVNLLLEGQQFDRGCTGRAQASSDNVTYDFFCVEYLGDRRYRMANKTRKSSTADRTGSFW